MDFGPACAADPRAHSAVVVNDPVRCFHDETWLAYSHQNFKDKSLQIKPNKKTNKEWRAMFSQKHRDFSIFFLATRCDGLISLFLQRFIGIQRPYFLTKHSEVLHREVCLILIVKYLWWRSGNWVTEFVRETASFGLWTWMVNNRG